MVATEVPPAPETTSEKLFLRKLLRVRGPRHFKEIWRNEYLEPHAHLFVLIVAALALGLFIWALGL